MCTAQVQEAKYSMDERARQYKSEKFDKMSRDAQEKIGEQSGGLYRTVEQVPLKYVGRHKFFCKKIHLV